MIIGVMGLNGSGKDTVADYIASKISCKKVSLSDIVREETSARGLDATNRDNLNAVSDALRKIDGPDYLMKRVLSNYIDGDNLVLSSFRHPSEIILLKSKKGLMFRVDADSRLRFERVKNRGRDIGDSFEKFIEKEKRELSNPDKDKMQISACLALADFVLDNNSSRDVLFSQIDSLLKKIGLLD